MNEQSKCITFRMLLEILLVMVLWNWLYVAVDAQILDSTGALLLVSFINAIVVSEASDRDWL